MNGRSSFEPQFVILGGYNSAAMMCMDVDREYRDFPSDMFRYRVPCSFWFYNKRLEEDEAALSGAIRGEL